MNLLVLLAFVAGVLLGVGRGVDLALYTDAATGLCAVGSAWWRYAALGAAAALCFAAGRCVPARPRTLCACRPMAGWLALLTAVLFGVSGALRLLSGFYRISAIVRALLELGCAVWLWRLGCAWLRKDEWRAPTNSMAAAVFGSAVFYWCVLARFMENSSSWHRVGETAMVWQYLAALVFLTELARALYLPETSDGKTLCAGGLCSFALCLCWQMPQTAADFAQTGALTQAKTYFGLALCGVGLLGGVCAAACLRAPGAKKDKI